MVAPLKLGLAGVGTVGGGVLGLLAARGAALAAKCGRPIEVVAVSARNRRKKRDADISRLRFVADPVALATDPGIDVFVELIGGEEGVAKTSIEAALKAGKHVVTANKALLAQHGPALAALAEKHGVALNFEGAVAGGIPVVKVMRDSLQGNAISRVYGILNGTCNYILTLMQKEGRPFAEVLEEAQAQGYAEADPTFDIGGFDTAHKLALLTTLAFGTRTSFESIYIEGIETITPADIEAADDLGYRIKLLGVAQRTAEIGVRMALGAEGRSVLWLVLRQGLVPLGLGLAAGVGGASLLSRVLESVLVQVTANDPATFVSITALLGAVAILACLLPARRASRLDPLTALRRD